ncbi:MAG: cadherin-like domain-containing protein, partial [Calditrichaceae bacterium]|nr:cadherin-like domain-containing protein [Calditrichaceae bacterium]
MARSSKSSIIPILFILISAILPALGQVTYTWNAASADWDSAASWLPAGVPGPQDTAIINSGAATLNRDAQVGGFILNAGILTGGGSLHVSGAMNWSGGRLEGSDTVMVAAGAALAITNAADIEVNGKVLHLAGNGSWSGNGKLRLKNGAVVSIAAGATFALQSNAILEMSTGGGSIRNSGVFSKTGGGAASDLTAPLINQGTVSVFSGTLQLKGGGSASGSVFETGSGNTLVFSGGTHDLDGVNFTGSGTVQFPDATINALGGGITVGNGVSADLSGSNGKIQGGGPVTINGTLIWNRGTIGSAGSLTINGTLLLAGTFPKTLDGRTLANHGSVAWSGSGALRLQNNAVLANQAGGVFDLQTDALLDFIDPVGGIFTNAGAFTKSGGVSFATLDVSLANSGIVNVNSGTLKLARGSDLGGTIQVAANSVMEFDGGVHTLNNAAVAGEGLLQQTSNTVNTSGAGAAIASPATFLLQGGLLGGDGPLAVNGTFRWSGGTISGTGALVSNNVLSIEGSAIKILDGRTLTNAGSGSWSGAGELRLRNNGILLNQAGGVFDIQTDAILNYLTPNGGTVQNSGVFSKSAGAGTTSINVLLANNGTLGINSGSIKLAKGSSSAGGTFSVAPGSLLDLSGDVHNFDNTLFDGGGNAQINNAVVNVSGAGLTVAPSAALAMIQSGSILQGSGPVAVNGTFTWDRGTLTGSGGFTVSGVLNLTGAFTKFLDGKTLTNAGMVKWIDPGGLRLSNNAAIVNQAGAVFDLQTDATLQFLAPGGTLSNFGTLLKSGGAGAATLNAPYANNGEFSVNSGTLRLANGGSGSGGTFNAAAGCVLEFDGGVHNLDNVTFGGGGAVQLTSNTVNISGSGAIFAPPLTLNLAGGIFSGTAPITVNGVFNWTRGTITGSGAFTVNNLFNISGDNVKSLDGRTLTNAGTAAWSGNGELRMFNQAALLNQAGATFDMQSNAAMKYSTPLGGSVTNAGTMRKTGGGAISNIEVALDNSGVLEVQNGTLAFWSTLFNSPTGTIGGSGALDVSHAVFSSQGSLNPGASPGILTVIGDYAQHAPGQLNIELGGLLPGSGYDRLAVSDSAQIGGPLNLAYTNGFVPAVGDEFTVLTYGIHNGVFSGITHPAGGVTFTADYTPSGVVLHTIRTNIAPSANDDIVSTAEEAALDINVLANDSDGDGDTLTISGFTQPQHGGAAQAGDSTLSYLPALNFFGADSFRYFVIDGYGGSDSATVRITVLPVNDPPVISSPLPEVSFPEDSSATLNLTPYASDVDNSVTELSWSAQVIGAQLLSAAKRNALPNYEAELHTIVRSVPAFRDRNEKSSPNLQPSMFNVQSSTEVDPEDLQIVIDPASGIASFSATLDSSGVFTVVFTLSDPGGL